MPLSYDERAHSLSPAKAGFGRTGGKASLPLWIAGDDVVPAITRILGSVQRGEDGRLIRGLPLKHPQFPWMVASTISNIQGHGGEWTVTVSAPPVQSESLPSFALYPWYLYEVEFEHFPWQVCDDESVQVVETTWFDDDGVEQDTVYAKEYQRFVDVSFEPGIEVVTANYGQQKFRRDDADPPHGYTFPGSPRVYVPKATVIIRWHFVPFDLLLDAQSTLFRYQGRINQTAFMGFAAGSLLYLSPRVKRYVPPVPYASFGETGVSFDESYLCDIELICEYTDRTTPSAPTPTNANWMAEGHNLLPWYGDRQYYYVTAVDPTVGSPDTDQTKWVPQYRSCLFQHLFTDPTAL